jgi:hypothetical protein
MDTPVLKPWQRDYSFLTKITAKNDFYRNKMTREVMRELGKTDLYFLCKYLLGFNQLETQTPIHHEMCRRLEEPFERELQLMFRGSFKTTIGIGRVIQEIIKNPEGAQIGVGSDQKERAEERTLVIRDILEGNAFLQKLYPEIFYTTPQKESDQWTSYAFNVKRSKWKEGLGFRKSTVSAFGLRPLPTGSHYTFVWLDDVENEANVNNDKLVEQLVANVSGLIPTLQSIHIPVLMTGTIYHPKGPNSYFQNLWPVYKVPILNSRGQSNFPSQFPLEDITKIRRDTNEWIWQGQYMLKSVPRTELNFYPFMHDAFGRCGWG